VLCFYGLNRSLLSTSENIYLAAGKPEVRTKLNLLQLVLMAVLMYPLTIRYGIMGAAVTAMLPSLLVVFLTLHEAGKIIGESFDYIARNFVPAAIGSLIMAVAIWGWQVLAVGLSPVVRLAVSVVVGGAVYVGYLWWRNKEIFYEVKGLVGKR
jgi:lipopolysaccharide exporter